MRKIDADELIRILEIMEKAAQEHPEVGLRADAQIRKLKSLVEMMADGGVLLEPGEVIIPLRRNKVVERTPEQTRTEQILCPGKK